MRKYDHVHYDLYREYLHIPYVMHNVMMFIVHVLLTALFTRQAA